MQTSSGFDPWRWWRELDPQQRLLAGAIQLAVGLAMTFYGFRLFRAFLTIAGFALGASLGLSLTRTAATAGSYALAVGLGLVGALALWALFRVGALIAGAALGAAAGQAAAIAIPGAAGSQWQWLLLLAGLVVGGILGWRLQRPLIIVATAVSGAWGAMVALAMLLGHGTPGQAVPAGLGTSMFTPGLPGGGPNGSTLWLVGTLVLALLGIAFQWRDTQRHRRRRF